MSKKIIPLDIDKVYKKKTTKKTKVESDLDREFVTSPSGKKVYFRRLTAEEIANKRNKLEEKDALIRLVKLLDDEDFRWNYKGTALIKYLSKKFTVTYKYKNK